MRTISHNIQAYQDVEKHSLCGVLPNGHGVGFETPAQRLPPHLTATAAMRLLDTKTLELREFDAPPEHYAILSHTWGLEEVTYQHLIVGDGRQRQGWSKLQGACDLAAKDGWSLLWMDTCCIDKTNNVDLSEAINSMYKWYQASSICYAYLEDVELIKGVAVSSVSPLNHVFAKVRSRPDFKQAFGDSKQLEFTKHMTARESPDEPVQGILSRWFTRGWTLQELVAPKYLLFLDKGWRDIGNRMRWAAQIEAMTAIDRQYFSGRVSVHDKNKCPAATKFAWASLRSTSRSEDHIYCLIGMLNVNMPLLYGEGAQNAFYRLQRKVIKRSDDESILAWQLPTSTPMQWDNILAPELSFFQWLNDLRQPGSTHKLELYTFDANRSETTMTNKGLKLDVRLVDAVADYRQIYTSSDAVHLLDEQSCTEDSDVEDLCDDDSCVEEPYIQDSYVGKCEYYHLQLNCLLRNIEDPSVRLPLTISLVRDLSQEAVFVRKTQYVNIDQSWQLESVLEPRQIYLRHDANLQYSPALILPEQSVANFTLEVSSDISIRDVHTFAKTDAMVKRHGSARGEGIMQFGLRAGQFALINAGGHSRGQFWACWMFLGSVDLSPWVTLINSDDLYVSNTGSWVHTGLTHHSYAELCHIRDPSSRARVEPSVVLDCMMSTGYRGMLDQGNAQVIARVQPRQPDGWRCQFSSTTNHSADRSYLLRLSRTIVSQEPQALMTPKGTNASSPEAEASPHRLTRRIYLPLHVLEKTTPQTRTARNSSRVPSSIQSMHDMQKIPSIPSSKKLLHSSMHEIGSTPSRSDPFSYDFAVKQCNAEHHSAV